MRSIAHHGVPVLVASVVIGLGLALRYVAGRSLPQGWCDPPLENLIVSGVCIAVAVVVVRWIGFALIRPIPNHEPTEDRPLVDGDHPSALWPPGREPFRPLGDDGGMEFEQGPQTTAGRDPSIDRSPQSRDDRPHADCGDI